MAYTIQQATAELNGTLKSLGYEYQIDATNDQTIEAGFKVVGAFAPSMQSAILDMQMKILKVRAYTSMFTESKNPMRRFWRDAVDYGGGIQEIFLKLIKAEDGYWAHADMTINEADEIARDLVSWKDDEIVQKIHPVSFKFRIKMSISDLEYSKIFTPNGYADFIGAKYANFQQSAEAKLMQLGIDKLKEMVAKQACVFETGLSLNSPNEVTGTVERINTVSDGMQTLTGLYNKDGVDTTTDFNNLYLVVTPAFINRLRSRGYANAFNLEEYKAKNRLIMLPAGTTIGVGPNGKEIGCMLVDYRAMLIAIRYWEVKPFIVSNTDYRNTFMNVQGIADYNTFFNAVAFETGESDFFTGSDERVLVTSKTNLAGGNVKVNGKDATDFLVSGSQLNSSYLYDFPIGAPIDFEGNQQEQEFLVNLDNGETIHIDQNNGAAFYITDKIKSITVNITA